VPPLGAVGRREPRPLAAGDLQRDGGLLGAPGIKDAPRLLVAERAHAPAAALASATALAKTSAVTAACASVRMSGGENRIAFLPHSSTRSPRRKQSCATASASSCDSSSTPIMSPTPRTSVTLGTPANLSRSIFC